ncbi:quinic acid utilization activator [Fusarium agapanthi]|uniref:Quinic acid utilization activator n=1 Tax=Fusarium agapanthi TaxID=1803897 RepID=A0A9P5AWG4_9HYPO|nr:quinic acid utilization activator [Fusarium agapanthi]
MGIAEPQDELTRRRERGRRSQAAFRKRQAQSNHALADQNARLKHGIQRLLDAARGDERPDMLGIFRELAVAADLKAPPKVAMVGTGLLSTEASDSDTTTTDANRFQNLFSDIPLQMNPSQSAQYRLECSMWLDPLHYLRVSLPPQDILPYLGTGAETFAGLLFWSVMEHYQTVCTQHNAKTVIRKGLKHSKATQDIKPSFIETMAKARVEYKQTGSISQAHAVAAEKDLGLVLCNLIETEYRSTELFRPTMPMTSPDTRSRGQPEATQRASKRARIDLETSEKEPNGRNRLRITRACNECRRRKDRCGGQRPSCKSCIDNNRTCSYGPSKKRGLPSGYVRGIETLLGFIFKSIQGSEEWICALLEGVIQQSSFCPASGLHDANISVDLLLETWHKSSVSKKMGSLLFMESEFDEEGTDSSQVFDTKVVEGLTLLVSTKNETGASMIPMDTSIAPPDLPTFDHSPLPIPHDSPRRPNGGELFRTTVSRQPEPVSRPLKSTPSPVPDLPKNWSYLLDLYFETTHCWFPISQKHELFRAAYTLSNEPSTASISSLSAGELAFLHTVLTYASYQSTALSKTMVSARLDTLPNLASSNVLLQGGLLADGNEEWEPWNLKILVEPQFQQDQENTKSHVPGHVISAFSRSLQAILSLNGLIHHQKNLPVAGNFGELMSLCKENLSTIINLKATSLSPQALGLWVASITVFELAAAESLICNRPILERPSGYRGNVSYLASLTEKRVRSIGRCVISPVVKACMELVARSLRHQEGHYTASNIGDGLHYAKEAVAKCLETLQESLGGTSQDNASNDLQFISASNINHSLPQMHLAVGKEPVPSQFDLPPTPSTLLSNTARNSMPHNEPNAQPASVISFPIDPELVSNIEDDGLFDSLATLDSTDWLANPTEFIQHFGMLDDAPSNIEHLFDMGF